MCAVTAVVLVTTHQDVAPMGAPSVVGVRTQTGAFAKAPENVWDALDVPAATEIVPTKSLLAAFVWRRLAKVAEGVLWGVAVRHKASETMQSVPTEIEVFRVESLFDMFSSFAVIIVLSASGPSSFYQ